MKIQLRKKNDIELFVQFPYREDWIARIREMTFRKWHPEEQAWVIPYSTGSLNQLLKLFEGIPLMVEDTLLEECDLLSEHELDVVPIHLETIDFEQSSWSIAVKRQLSIRLKLKGYSRQTMRTYISHLERFYRFYETCREVPVHDLLLVYSNKLVGEGRSHAYVNQAISAIKFHLEKVCGLLEGNFSYIRPKKQHKLPNVLSVGDVKRLLDSVQNLKHRAILLLTYSSGLRVSEVVKLQLRDLDQERRTLHVRQGKGRKDRLTVLSEHAFAAVQLYVSRYKPERWLFPGQHDGRSITERSVQKIFEKALVDAKIVKDVSLHSLRHSFATHLLEGGIDIRYIQELLGHRNVQTTEIYTHVAVKNIKNIKSPLDTMLDG
ncbi:tyrosine-type recombinase/integrase [Cohnella yongneupensis]|uniref:Tyrosine-type recombinase/integrase n=1 Tax=Cohnella yongneupensis TaxID=425006 RepID=A0ABW0R6T4_9BACL